MATKRPNDRRPLRQAIHALAEKGLLPPRFRYVIARCSLGKHGAALVAYNITPLVQAGDEWKGDAA